MNKVILTGVPLLAVGFLTACSPNGSCSNSASDPMYTKEGFLINDDQAPLCEPSTPWFWTPPDTPKVPEVPEVPEVPVTPVKENNGYGNCDDDAPGGSEFNNNAENAGGNHNGESEGPGKSTAKCEA